MTATPNSLRPLKILHLSGRPGWCGESNRVLVECAGLTKLGHEVLLGTAPDTALVPRAKALGIRIDTRFRFSKGFRPSDTLHDVRAIAALLRENRFDIVHIHTSRDTWPAALALGPKNRPGRPLLVRTKHHSLKTSSNLAHRWLYGSRIDEMVLASNSLRNSIHSLTNRGIVADDHLHVIHSSIDVHRFDPAKVSGEKVRAEFGLVGRFVIGLVGRFAEEKGHVFLLRALEPLVRDCPALVCLLVGDGSLLDEMRSHVAAGPLRNHVIFSGARNDIPEITAAFDVAVVPSVWLEASPAVIKEGMAMRVAVVASDVGGASEIIADGRDGVLVAPGDVPALRAALTRLLKDDPLRREIAARGRDKITGAFSDEMLCDRSVRAYHRMLKWTL